MVYDDDDEIQAPMNNHLIKPMPAVRKQKQEVVSRPCDLLSGAHILQLPASYIPSLDQPNLTRSVFAVGSPAVINPKPSFKTELIKCKNDNESSSPLEKRANTEKKALAAPRSISTHIVPVSFQVANHCLNVDLPSKRPRKQ
jgi:hypothetical protein